MRNLTLALVAVLGIVTTDAAAQCLGCGHYGDCGAPITCDYSYLWANFSPSQCHYVPKPGLPCGGCRLGSGRLLCQLAGACQGHGAHAIDGRCGKPKAACERGKGGDAVANTSCRFGDRGRLLRGYDNCCSPPSPNIGWDGWGHGCGGAGLGGYGGHSLASWHGLGGGGHRLMGGGCDTYCDGSPCAGGCGLRCHSFHADWLGSLMERLRNCGSACAMSHRSLDRCGLLSLGWASYPAGHLDVSFGCAHGCNCDGSPTGKRDAGAEIPLPDVVLQAEPSRDSRFENSVPPPPRYWPTGTDATLKLDQFSLKR